HAVGSIRQSPSSSFGVPQHKLAQSAADNVPVRSTCGHDLSSGRRPYKWPCLLPSQELVDWSAICILAFFRSLRTLSEEPNRTRQPVASYEAICGSGQMEVHGDQADFLSAGHSDWTRQKRYIQFASPGPRQDHARVVSQLSQRLYPKKDSTGGTRKSAIRRRNVGGSAPEVLSASRNDSPPPTVAATAPGLVSGSDWCIWKKPEDSCGVKGLRRCCLYLDAFPQEVHGLQVWLQRCGIQQSWRNRTRILEDHTGSQGCWVR